MIPVPQNVLIKVCDTYGINPQPLVRLGGGREDSDGVVYLYPSGSTSRVLKIGALAATDTGGLMRLEERLKFVHFLAQNGVDIVYPIQQPDGSLFTCAPDGEHIFIAYTMEKINGSHPATNELTLSIISRWGQVIGRMHRVTQSYRTGQCEALDPQSQLPLLGWQQEWDGFYRSISDSKVKQQWLAMRNKLEELPVTRDAYGFIHNDPHQQNIMVTTSGDRLVMLDFDVANYHWFVTDIPIAMQGLMFDVTGGMERPLSRADKLHEFLDEFMQGYEKENHLAPFWLDKIDLFISYRRMLLFAAMQGWLDTQPKLRASWKRMIMEDPPILSRG